MSYLPKKEARDDDVVSETTLAVSVAKKQTKNMIVDAELINDQIIATDSAKNVTFYDKNLKETQNKTISAVGRVVVRGSGGSILVGCMDGKVVRLDQAGSEIQETSFKPHARFVGGISVAEDGLIASIGFDKRAVVTKETEEGFEQVAFIDSLTNPTAVAWTDRGLAVSREDCTSIQLLTSQLEKIRTIRLIDAHYMPHSFTVFDMSYNPTTKEIACLTSHTPYARVLIVKPDDTIVSHPTLIPQDKYSLGRIDWVDSSTLAVAGDDGSVRLFDGSKWQNIAVADSRLRSISSQSGYIVTSSIDKEIELVKVDEHLEEQLQDLKLE